VVDILNDFPEDVYRKTLRSVPGLPELVKKYHPQADADAQFFLMEFALHGLAEYSFLSKHLVDSGLQFRDLLSGMLNMSGGQEEDEDLSDMDFYR